MRIIMVTGMLGSGKTTFIKRFVGELCPPETKAAVLVNEVGDIGIDDRFMRRLGLNVYELLGGCICCSLAVDLITTLQQLQADYAPDVVWIEPSGAADPAGVIDSLNGYAAGRPIELKTVALLDPLRLAAFLEVLAPLTRSVIEQADVIVVTKADLAAPEQMEMARQSAKQYNRRAPLFDLSGEDRPHPNLIKELWP